jgi:hypothetical protein
MNEPFHKVIDDSELRRSLVRVVKLALGDLVKVKPGSLYLPNLVSWEAAVAEGGLAKTITLQTSGNIRLGNVTLETTHRLLRRLTNAIMSLEIEAVNKLKDAADTDDIIMYIKKDFRCYDDPSLLRKQQIGIFGWEEIAVVAK